MFDRQMAFEMSGALVRRQKGVSLDCEDSELGEKRREVFPTVTLPKQPSKVCHGRTKRKKFNEPAPKSVDGKPGKFSKFLCLI